MTENKNVVGEDGIARTPDERVRGMYTVNAPVTPKQKIKKFLKDNSVGWAFNSLLFVGLVVFTFIPAIYSLYMSFFRTDGVSLWEWYGLKNYKMIFGVKWATETKGAFLNTFYYTVVSVPLGLVTSYFVALLVNTKVKGVNAFRVMFYLPCMIPAIAGVFLYKDMMRYSEFTTQMGFFNRVLVGLGLPASRWVYTEGPKAIASLFFLNLWGVGGGMILWLSAFKAIDVQFYEAADIEGASKLVKFAKITIPMSTPMIFYNLIMSVIGCVQYTGSLMYSDGKDVSDSLNTLGVLIYQKAFTTAKWKGYASALSWVMLIMIGILTFVLFKTSKWVFYGEDD